MKAHHLRSSFKQLILGFAVLASAALSYMYFSHDVGALNDEWPHRVGSAEYELQERKPKGWIRLKEVSPFAKWAIVLSEDWAFYQHRGIDVEQIKVALSEMMEERRIRGASTITQQMVKNVFLSEDRTLWRKVHEIILAQKVERVLPKDRILEVYLNVIEFGPGIYGIGQAAYHYFRKPPLGLGPREGAFLAMLLPSPKKYYASYRRERLSEFARERVDKILEKLRMGKIITRDVYESERLSRFSWEKR